MEYRNAEAAQRRWQVGEMMGGAPLSTAKSPVRWLFPAPYIWWARKRMHVVIPGRAVFEGRMAWLRYFVASWKCQSRATRRRTPYQAGGK